MVAGRAVKRILEWFCDGSVEQLLVGMVDSSVLDSKELKRLAERIAAAESDEKKVQAIEPQTKESHAKGGK
jgi:predicted transcriptional regulator